MGEGAKQLSSVIVDDSKTDTLLINYKGKVDEVDRYSHQLYLQERLTNLSNDRMRVTVSLSKHTESVYGVVTFTNRSGVVVFSIKNHASRSDSVSRNYLYDQYKNIDDLFRQLSKDLKKAGKSGSYCIGTDLTMVEYDLLKYLVTEKQSIYVNTGDSNTDISKFEVISNSEDGSCPSKDAPFISRTLLTSLYDKKMLKDKLNRWSIENLVVSKLGYIAIARNRKKFDADYKFGS